MANIQPMANIPDYRMKQEMQGGGGGGEVGATTVPHSTLIV